MTDRITWTPVSSSNIEAVGKCTDGHLYARFKGNGTVYRYDGLAAAHHDALTAPGVSPGRYLDANIKKAGHIGQRVPVSDAEKSPFTTGNPSTRTRIQAPAGTSKWYGTEGQ